MILDDTVICDFLSLSLCYCLLCDVLVDMASGPTPLLSMDVKPTGYDGGAGGEEFFVRIRGLPFSTTSTEIVEFFHGEMMHHFTAVYYRLFSMSCFATIQSAILLTYTVSLFYQIAYSTSNHILFSVLQDSPANKGC